METHHFIFQEKNTAADIAGGQSVYQQQERMSRSQTMSSMSLHTPHLWRWCGYYGYRLCYWITEWSHSISLCLCVHLFPYNQFAASTSGNKNELYLKAMMRRKTVNHNVFMALFYWFWNVVWAFDLQKAIILYHFLSMRVCLFDFFPVSAAQYSLCLLFFFLLLCTLP